MAVERIDQRTCDLGLGLFRCGGVHTWYDAEAGLRRRFVLFGYVDDPYRTPLGDIDDFGEGDYAFHKKAVRELHAPQLTDQTSWLYAGTGIYVRRTRQVIQSADNTQARPVRWVGSSKGDVRRFPEEVRLRIGGALWEAQLGRKAPYAKPLRGFGGAGVLEIVDDFDGDTYRAVYTVRFAGAVYVLHAFKKKSKRGIATPKAELDLIRQRFERAKEDYEQWSASRKSKSL